MTATTQPLREVVDKYVHPMYRDMVYQDILASAEFVALQERVAALEAAVRKARDYIDFGFGVGPPSVDAAIATLRSVLAEYDK